MTMNAPNSNPDGSGSPPPRAEGAKVYRGRSVAELLPQVRTELGPDAVVLRQREGRSGGIGGFFAQRFVEIEATSAAPQIDLYDDTAFAAAGAEPEQEQEAPWDGGASYARQPAVTPSAQAAAVRAAAPVWPDWTELHAPEVEPTVARSERPPAEHAAGGWPDLTIGAQAPNQPSSFAAQLAAAEHPLSGGPVEEMDDSARFREFVAGHAELAAFLDDYDPEAERGEEAEEADLQIAEMEAMLEDEQAEAAETAGRSDETRETFERQVTAIEPMPDAAAAAGEGTLAAAREALLAGREAILAGRETIVADREAALNAREATQAQAPALGEGDHELIGELLAAGCSDTLARRLIDRARAHHLPFAPDGDLRDAVRAELARSLQPFAGLPSNGAMVAVIGAGGAGKTRVAAALAAAYRASSALSIRAAMLGEAAGLTPLAALLAPHGVPVDSGLAGDERREGELVVLDTPSISPGDPAGIEELQADLLARTPDAVLLAMPATITVAAARRMLAALGGLEASALVVTHADEVEQIGVLVEVAIRSGTPIAYIHEGLDLPGSLYLADPALLAAALLP